MEGHLFETKNQNQHLIAQLNNQGFDGDKIWLSYSGQRQHTKGRVDANNEPIYFRLSFQQWLDYWLQPDQSGQPYLCNRGTRSHQLVMSRINDLGHYEVGNVHINSVGGNLSEAKSGKNHPFFSKPLSHEHKEKIAQALKGLTAGDKHPMFGKSRSIQTRQKLSAALKGKRVGSKHPRARPIIYQGIYYEYINAAAMANDVSKTTIRNHCSNPSLKDCYYL